MKSEEGTCSDIKNVYANSAHVFFTKHTFFSCPLEGGNAGILDFIQILHTLGGIDQCVRTGGVGTETPNLSRFGDIPSIFVRKDASPNLEIVTSIDLSFLNCSRDFFFKRCGLAKDTIVLVL